MLDDKKSQYLFDKCIEFGTNDFLYLCVLHGKARNLVPDLIHWQN